MQLLLLFSFTVLCSSSVTTDEITFRNLISTIWKSVLLLGTEYTEFNLDGLAGYKILQVQLNGILEKCNVKKHPAICLLLERMSDLLNDSLIKAKYFTKQRDPKYFEEFQDVLKIDQLWNFTSSWNQTRPELVYTELLPNSLKCFSEELFDQCASFLLGSLTEEKGPCFVNTQCRKKMTQKGCSGYSLSHQLLYFIFGKRKGCADDLFVKDATHYMNVFCANMMKENLELESTGYPLEYQDIFLENILLCGLSGYSDFFKLHWMDKIISWQDPKSGCFGLLGDENNLVIIDNGRKPVKRVKRRLRMFSDICECHKTSVAVGSLSGFLHFLYAFSL